MPRARRYFISVHVWHKYLEECGSFWTSGIPFTL